MSSSVNVMKIKNRKLALNLKPLSLKEDIVVKTILQFCYYVSTLLLHIFIQQAHVFSNVQ